MSEMLDMLTDKKMDDDKKDQIIDGVINTPLSTVGRCIIAPHVIHLYMYTYLYMPYKRCTSELHVHTSV